MKAFENTKLVYIGTKSVDAKKTEQYKYGRIYISVEKCSDYLNCDEFVIVSFDNMLGGRVSKTLVNGVLGYFGIAECGGNSICRNVFGGRVAA